MDCTRAQELMSLALDGQLTAEETTEFNAHLSSCDDCAREYALYESIHMELGSYREDEAELPEGFHEELMAKIGEITDEKVVKPTAKKVMPIRKRIPRRYMNVAAAFVLVVVFALIGFNNLYDMRTDVQESSMTSEDVAYDMPAEEGKMAAPAAEENAADMAEPKMAMEAAPSLEVADVAMDEAEMAIVKEAPAPEELTVDLEMSVEETESVSLDTYENEVDDGDASLEAVDAVTFDESVETAGVGDGNDSDFAKDGDQSNRMTKSLERDDALMNKAAPERYPMLWWMIIGGFLVVITFGSTWIIQKMK